MNKSRRGEREGLLPQTCCAVGGLRRRAQSCRLCVSPVVPIKSGLKRLDWTVCGPVFVQLSASTARAGVPSFAWCLPSRLPRGPRGVTPTEHSHRGGSSLWIDS